MQKVLAEKRRAAEDGRGGNGSALTVSSSTGTRRRASTMKARSIQ
jgi:hypothetical protein